MSCIEAYLRANKEHRMALELTINKSTITKSITWLVPVLVVIAIICLMSVNRTGAIGDEIKKNRVQAVSLTGGGLFYGHAEMLDHRTLLLKDAHNLRQETSGKNKGTVRVESIETLADKPEKNMIIPLSRVAYIENLLPSSPVSKAVKK